MNRIRKDNDLLHEVYTNIIRFTPAMAEPTLPRHTIGVRFDELRLKHDSALRISDVLGTCIVCGYSADWCDFMVSVVNDEDEQECLDFVEGCPLCEASGEHIAVVHLRYSQYLGRRETMLRLQSEGVKIRYPLPIEATA